MIVCYSDTGAQSVSCNNLHTVQSIPKLYELVQYNLMQCNFTAVSICGLDYLNPTFCQYPGSSKLKAGSFKHFWKPIGKIDHSFINSGKSRFGSNQSECRSSPVEF